MLLRRNSITINKYRYFLYFAIYCLIYYLALKFIFPGYFRPFIPHHSDILDYPYDFAALKFDLSSRPIGLLLTYLFGMFFSWKGVVLSGFFCTVCSMLIIISICEKELDFKFSLLAIISYGIFIFASSSFYVSYSFDIYSTYSLFIGLLAIRLTYFSSKKNENLRVMLYILLLLCAFLSKETYILTFCFIFFAYLFIDKDKKTTSKYLFGSVGAGIISILYGKFSGSEFISMDRIDTNNPYFVSYDLSSICNIMMYYLKWVFTIPVVVIFLIILIRMCKEKKYIHLIVLSISGVFSFIPYSILPNHVIPHYSFVGIPIIYLVALIFDYVLKESGIKRVLATCIQVCVIVLFVFSEYSSVQYGYDSIKPWIACENDMKKTIDSVNAINNRVNDGDKVLVLGIEDTVETIYRSNYAFNNLLPKNVHYDVLTDYEEYCGKITDKVSYICNLSEMNYNYVIQYTDSACNIYELSDGLLPALAIKNVYPGRDIMDYDLLEDGSVNIGITSEINGLNPIIMINGVALKTDYSDSFVSANIPSEYLQDGEIFVNLYYPYVNNYETEGVKVLIG